VLSLCHNTSEKQTGKRPASLFIPYLLLGISIALR